MRPLRIFLLLSLFTFPSRAQVRTWVSSQGLDVNPCTRIEPCRNFGAAITVVAPDGEVVALDSAGYGPITIAKNVSLIAPEGVHAAIAPTGGNAITVIAPASHVNLRNLYLNGQGASNGIDVSGGTNVSVENIVINGFSAFGLNFQGSGRLTVTNSTVRNCASTAINVEAGPIASFDGVRIFGNGDGLVSSATTSIRESLAAHNSGAGFLALAGGKVAAEDTVSHGNSLGFAAVSGGIMTLSRCSATSNTTGVRAASSGSRLYVSETTIAGNTTGVSVGAPGQVFTRLNNLLQENGASDAFSANYGAN